MSIRRQHEQPRAAQDPRRAGKRFLSAALILLAIVLVPGGLAYLSTRLLGSVKQPGGPRSRPGTASTGSTVALPRYHALVIGINDYARHAGQGWSPLRTARSDAEAVGSLLEDLYGFAVTRLLDRDATRSAIIAALDGLVTLGSHDAVLVYFAGHGQFDPALGEGYWIPSDARMTAQGRPAKHEWLWNSTITKIVDASAARHVLILADSCYGGSLFRGGARSKDGADLTWYLRALAKPSRFLISSGDVEPVLDGGGRHSVFARQILAYLNTTGNDVFSASELGMSLRQTVGRLTGQMVRMGPLAVAGHAGGEFVFVKREASQRLFGQTSDTPVAPAAPAPAAPASEAGRQGLLQDTLVLGRSGATNAATRLLAAATGPEGPDFLARAVAAYLDQERRAAARNDLRALIRTLEARQSTSPSGQDDETRVKPRILACLGPEDAEGTGAGGKSVLLYRICLRAQLQEMGGVQVVEREAIEQVLQEMNLGSGGLADPGVRTQIGRLLPAGMLLVGDVMTAGKEENLYLRLIDTETTRILASFSARKQEEDDIVGVCWNLASNIVARAVTSKPLAAPATSVTSTRLTAGVGLFHGVREGMRFTILKRVVPDRRRPDDYREEELGTARIVKAGRMSSDLAPEWASGTGRPHRESVWVKEITR